MSPPEPESAAARHLAQAVRAIDAQFGAGYARDHPDLVAALVNSATMEAAVATGYSAHQEALDTARQISAEIGETILKLKPRIFG